MGEANSIEIRMKVKRVMKETANHGADIVVDAAGKPITFLQSIEMVRPGGKMFVVAYFEESFLFNPTLLVDKKVQLISSISDLPGAFKLLKVGKIKAEQVVSHIYPLDKINEAYEMQMNVQESIKVMVEP
jgi:threonine dehydrogenase-like Zn-dependent dehydrogenase